MTDTHTPRTPKATKNRIRHRPEDLVPQRLMYAVLALLITITSLVAVARLTDRPLEAQMAMGPVLAEREIHLWGNHAGAARVTDADGAVIVEYGAGEAGFLSTIDRVVRFQRSKHRLPLEGALLVRLREGDRLSVYDPATDEEIELESFGKDNVAAFAMLLENR